MKSLIIETEILLTPDNPEQDGVLYFNDFGHEYYLTDSGQYYVPLLPGGPVRVVEELVDNGNVDMKRLEQLLKIGYFMEIKMGDEDIFSGICRGKKILSYYTSATSTSPPCFYELELENYCHISVVTGKTIEKLRSFVVLNFAGYSECCKIYTCPPKEVDYVYKN